MRKKKILMMLAALLTTATAWAQAVTLQDDNGTKYVNMPATGTNTLTLTDASVTTFKVYDDGGSGGNYSNNCSGTLTLTAPEGYVLQLSGNITTENYYDKLTVYDGSTDSGTKLLDAVSSTSDGTQTAIETVYSTGQSMTLYFYSDGSTNYAGLDLTVTLVSTSTESDITVNTATGGSVAADKSKAKLNDTVTLTATPTDGYLLCDLSVKDASNNAVAVTWDGPFSNTATFTMPGSAVTVTPTFTNTLTADGGLYINMPTTGTKTVTIPTGVQSFKVYDDGGKDGNYSNNCSGYLVLTAPTGYVLQLSGNITTENDYDKLTVYDNSEASGTKLLDAVISIQTVTSTGQSMTLYFESDNSRNYAGLDLTVTVGSPSTEYDITVNTATGGSVAASVSGTTVTTAKLNDTVTLTATPTDGYLLSGISVKDASNNAVAVTWEGSFSNTATFTMPTSAVTVTPSFTNDLTSLSVNMPTTGTKTVTIPTCVQSFKVYDDGGKDGDYSNNCEGYLVLTAPEGYVLQLSGSIQTEKDFDDLTVYDNSAASGTKLLDAVKSPSGGTATAIQTVTSTGRSMTLYFCSNNSGNFAGLDLTVTLISTSTEYNITVSNLATGGSVASDKSKAKVNETVTLTATPESSYLLSDLSVKDASNNAVAVTWDGSFSNTATFTMPATAVTVTPTFTNTLTADGGLNINMPTTGTKTATIPTGVQSFKVYDDGGSGGNYSNKCDGTFVLTAPEGYVLQLSGNITTERYDKLTVYDNSAASGTKLLDQVSSTYNGIQTAIQTVASTGQSMTLYFKSDNSKNYAGLDLTVTLVKQVTLADNADNASAITDADGYVADVTLSGRTLYKDGAWNTICLPFALTAEDIAASPLAGADIRELIPSTSGLEGTTLMLNFTAENEVTSIVAGTPYIIRWTKADGYVDDDAHNIVSPTFTDVTINAAAPTAVTSTKDGSVTFRGIYAPVDFTPDRSILYLGSENKLYYPNAAMTLNSNRAYFQLNNGLTVGDVTSAQLNFDGDEDEETTGIIELKNSRIEELKSDGAWYTLDGRKLNGKPTQKGVYINGGRKIVIK